MNASSNFSSNSSSSSSSSAEPVASVPIRVFGAVSYALLSCTSICLNLLLIAVLLHGHSHFRRLAFFTLAWQMVFCDLMTQAVQLIVAVPVTFAGAAVYGHPFGYWAVLWFDTVAYNATLYFSGLLTLNRLCVFFLPRLNQLLFAPGNICCTVAALWLCVFAYCACWNLIGCRKAFSETGFFMFHDCPTNLSEAGVAFRQITFAMSTYLPVLMLLAYLFCFAYIRFFFGRRGRRTGHHHSSSIRALPGDREEERLERARRQRETNFLIQSFLICGFLEIQNLAFDFAPLLFGSLQGQWPFVVTFAENWISILLNTISPVILFSFNGDVRKCAAQLLQMPCLRPARTAPVPALTQSVTIPPSQLLRPLTIFKSVGTRNNSLPAPPAVSSSVLPCSGNSQQQQQQQGHR